MEKIVVAEKYRHLESQLKEIPQLLEKGEIIYKARNRVIAYNANEIYYNIKAFKIPNFINQIAYSTIRKSKAERSFLYAQELIKAGFLTPEPICFIENHLGILLKESYYVSQHEIFDGMLRELESDSFESQKDLIKAFALYTACLHEAGIVHIDYSPGNILYKKSAQEYVFYLVDLNRMKFGVEVTADQACHNFRRLWGSDEKLLYFVKVYATKRNFLVQECQQKFQEEATSFWRTHGTRPGT